MGTSQTATERAGLVLYFLYGWNIASPEALYDMNRRSETQGGKNWILPNEINANRSSETLTGWKSGPNEGSVTMDFVKQGWSGGLKRNSLIASTRTVIHFL